MRLTSFVAAFAVSLASAACDRQPDRDEAPADIGPLKDVLERSAAEQLPDPHLAESRVVLELPTEPERKAAARRVLDLASEFRGAGIVEDSQDGDIKIMVQVPEALAEAFKKAIRDPDHAVAPDPVPEGGTAFVEVLIRR